MMHDLCVNKQNEKTGDLVLIHKSLEFEDHMPELASWNMVHLEGMNALVISLVFHGIV